MIYLIAACFCLLSGIGLIFLSAYKLGKKRSAMLLKYFDYLDKQSVRVNTKNSARKIKPKVNRSFYPEIITFNYLIDDDIEEIQSLEDNEWDNCIKVIEQ